MRPRERAPQHQQQRKPSPGAAGAAVPAAAQGWRWLLPASTQPPQAAAAARASEQEACSVGCREKALLLPGCVLSHMVQASWPLPWADVSRPAGSLLLMRSQPITRLGAVACPELHSSSCLPQLPKAVLAYLVDFNMLDKVLQGLGSRLGGRLHLVLNSPQPRLHRRQLLAAPGWAHGRQAGRAQVRALACHAWTLCACSHASQLAAQWTVCGLQDHVRHNL